jgi:hypothetical protein
MLKIPVDASVYQEQTFDIGGLTLRITLRYNAIGSQWSMDVFDVRSERFDAQGMAVVVGVPMMQRRPVDYLFWAHDLSAAQVDPVGDSDIANRIELYCALKSEFV